MKICIVCNHQFKPTGNNQKHCKNCFKEQNKIKASQYAKSAKGIINRKRAMKKFRQSLRGYLHKKYAGMFSRCNKPECISYLRYGGKGIKCEFKSLVEFVNWAATCKLPNIPFEIHRIDRNDNYRPDNIEFLTKKEHKKKHYFKELL